MDYDFSSYDKKWFFNDKVLICSQNVTDVS